MHLKKLLTVFILMMASLSAAEQELPVPLPSSQDVTRSYESSFIRMLVVLVGIIFLVSATLWILKRMGKGKFKLGGNGRSIEILERRPLSPKSMLYLVEVDNKRILISESQLEVRTLSNIEEIKEPPAE